jgi:multiple sugar transport system permease protein
MGVKAIYALLTLLSALFMFPVCVIFTNSFMSRFEIFNRYTAYITPRNFFYAADGIVNYARIGLIPDSVTLSQYTDLFLNNPAYLGLFWNSVLLALPIVAGQILISAPAAYAFEMSRFKYKEAIYFIYIVVMLTPLQVALVPNFIVAEWLGINGTRWAIILPGMINPFGVFLIRQFLKNLPAECVEAAKIDGAGHLRIIVSIVTPLFKSAVAALAILTVTENWNLVEQPLIFLKDSSHEPLSVFLSKLSESNMDIIFAASCFYMLPAILIFLYGQAHMIEGIRISDIR